MNHVGTPTSEQQLKAGGRRMSQNEGYSAGPWDMEGISWWSLIVFMKRVECVCRGPNRTACTHLVEHLPLISTTWPLDTRYSNCSMSRWTLCGTTLQSVTQQKAKLFF